MIEFVVGHNSDGGGGGPGEVGVNTHFWFHSLWRQVQQQIVLPAIRPERLQRPPGWNANA